MVRDEQRSLMSLDANYRQLGPSRSNPLGVQLFEAGRGCLDAAPVAEQSCCTLSPSHLNGSKRAGGSAVRAPGRFGSWNLTCAYERIPLMTWASANSCVSLKRGQLLVTKVGRIVPAEGR